MIDAKWTRLAGLCALTALTLQGVGVLAPTADQHLEHRFDLAHLVALPPELPGGTVATRVVTARLLEAPPLTVAELLATPDTSRGPPALI